MILGKFKIGLILTLVSLILGASVAVKNMIVDFRDSAAAQALNEVKALDNEILLRQQARIIEQRTQASSKISKLNDKSRLLTTRINNSVSAQDQEAIKSTVVDEINCRIDNFLNYDLCEK